MVFYLEKKRGMVLLFLARCPGLKVAFYSVIPPVISVAGNTGEDRRFYDSVGWF